MFDSFQYDTLQHQVVRPTRSIKAERFVNGEHTAADEVTRTIILRLLDEIGILATARQSQGDPGETPTANRRAAQKTEKRICFMASFLRTVSKVELFGILMDRHYWTDTPCGYEAARTITKALLDGGHILKVAGPRRGRGTVYRCSDAFQNRLEGWKGQLRFKRVRPQPIEVREPKKDQGGAFKKKRLPLDDFPSEAVRHHQQTVLRLNSQLSKHTLADASGAPLEMTLRRIFTGDLRNGGRLYADYQSLTEADRLRCAIDGEPVCEIDLKASHVAILAALYRHPQRLPQDPYAAISWVQTPDLRKAAKNLVQCMIHAIGGRPRRFPKQQDGITFRAKYRLGNVSVSDLLPAIFEVMPFLDGSPCLTLSLQYIEAEILISVLERCLAVGIAAFPIHDSLLVRRSDEGQVLQILEGTLREFLGPHAPWLDVSITGEAPRQIEPLPSPMDAEYRLQDALESLTVVPVEYVEEFEVIDTAEQWDH